MHYDRYEITPGESAMVYEFVSAGVNGAVEKLVVYSATNSPEFFNLGFGDKDQLTGDFDDTVVTNNGDSVKVMATVAATIYAFTDEFPDARIFAKGSTRSRTRLYRMGISNNLDVIKLDFWIFGLSEGDWEEFSLGTDYDAFLVVRKKQL
jgi:hypothetical protein